MKSSSHFPSLVLFASLAAGGGLCARADTGDFQVSIANDKITFSDTRNDGFDIISPNNRRLTYGQITPDILLIPQTDGFDIRFTYNNTSSEPVDLGGIVVGGIRLGDTVQSYDFRYDSKKVTLAHNNANFYGPGHFYPSQIYSPVSIIQNDNYTLGFSLQYPILEYKHKIRTQIRSPGGAYLAGGRNWEVEFKNYGQIPPGEQFVYTLTMRVTESGDEWMRTLLPYRDYFRSTYGGVDYQRNPNPVKAIQLADRSMAQDSNPRGFVNESRRPDVHGYEPWVNGLSTSPSRGFNRLMIFSPSGVYQHNQTWNYPFLFMTGLDDLPEMQSSMGEFTRLAKPDLDLGFWWGRSQQIHDYWDAPEGRVMDINDPADIQQALDELDQAVALGATIIGLDAFTKIGHWDGIRWLKLMQDRAPGVTFVIEPKAPDFLHRLAPVWFDHTKIIGSKVIADFLLPGHETWVGIRFDLIEDDLGRSLSSEERYEYLRHYNQMGYVAAPYWHNIDLAGAGDFSAAESWLDTIPRDLQIDPDEESSRSASTGGSSQQGDPDNGFGGNGGSLSSGPRGGRPGKGGRSGTGGFSQSTNKPVVYRVIRTNHPAPAKPRTPARFHISKPGYSNTNLRKVSLRSIKRYNSKELKALQNRLKSDKQSTNPEP